MDQGILSLENAAFGWHVPSFLPVLKDPEQRACESLMGLRPPGPLLPWTSQPCS